MAYWPMRANSTLPRDAREDIQLLVTRSADLLPLVEAAKKVEPGLQVTKVLQQLATDSGLPLDDVRRIFNSLENLRDLADEAGSPKAALSKVTEGLTGDVASAVENSTQAISEALALYDQDNPVALSFKAQRLTYLRERLFHEAEIISDARPVFDGKGERIVEFVISHSLIVTSFWDGSFHRQHYAVDNADIVAIRRACDRALLKSHALKDALGGKWPTEVLRDDSV